MAAKTLDVAPVIDLAREMVRREQRIDKMESELKREKEELELIRRERMPDLMRERDVASLELGSGWELSLKPVFFASLPSTSAIEKASEELAPELRARREEGLEWLRKNKAGDIIKNTVKVELGQGQTAVAKKIVAFIKTLKLSAERTEVVHSATLGKLLREKIKIGADVPFETFAVFSGQEAVVTPIKKK